jgi:hypothetical protein
MKTELCAFLRWDDRMLRQSRDFPLLGTTARDASNLAHLTCQVVGHRFTWQGPRPITRTVPNSRSQVQVSDLASGSYVTGDRCSKSRIQPSYVDVSRLTVALPAVPVTKVGVSRLAGALPAVSVAQVDVSRLTGRSPGYSVPAKILSPFRPRKLKL